MFVNCEQDDLCAASTGSAMTAITWRRARDLDSDLPPYSAIMRSKVEQAHGDVFVSRSAVSDLRELRDYIAESCNGRYQMFAQFSWRDYGLHVERKFEGIAFRFDDIADTILMRLAFPTMVHA